MKSNITKEVEFLAALDTGDEAVRNILKRIGSTPFPDGFQDIADDATMMIAALAARDTDAQAARIAEYEVRLRDLEVERDETMREALAFARVLHKTHYSDVTQWEPFDYPAGIISQIDNMVAGINARAKAAEAKLAKALEIIGIYDEESTCSECCDVTAINEKVTALATLEAIASPSNAEPKEQTSE